MGVILAAKAGFGESKDPRRMVEGLSKDDRPNRQHASFWAK
ncbi:MAG: hypothetical protein WCC12_15690 [Anaerolineales bacterium]